MIWMVDDQGENEPTRLVTEDEAASIYSAVSRRLKGLQPHHMPAVLEGVNGALRRVGCEAVVVERVEVAGVESTSSGNRLVMLVRRASAR